MQAADVVQVGTAAAFQDDVEAVAVVVVNAAAEVSIVVVALETAAEAFAVLDAAAEVSAGVAKEKLKL